MVWTNENVLEFIELYRRERLLWDPKHLQHKNRREVSAAWMRIQSRMNIHLSIVDLKKKKESLMTSFRFHWNRKKNNPNYRTAWFAYEAMDAFLCGRYECDTDNTDELENEFFNNNETYTQSQTNTDPISCRNANTTEKNTTTLRQARKSFNNKNNSRNLPDESTGQNGDNQKLDEYELYGQLLAKRLRKLDEHQRDVAMHDIDNIMFRAKMQGQTSQTRTYTPTSSPVPPKMKSPIFIVTQQNHTQYEDENISYQNHNITPSEPS